MATAGARVLSNQRLVDLLEQSERALAPSDFSSLLQKNKAKLCALLEWFKPPSAASKSAVTSNNVTINGVKKSISAQLSSFALRVSDRLDLDEAQSCELVIQYVSLKIVGPEFVYDNALLEEITRFYYDERVALLGVVESILRNCNDESHVFHKELNAFVQENLEAVWSALPGQYHALRTSNLPLKLSNDAFWSLWADQNAREQFALLKILFFIYYESSNYTPKNAIDCIVMLRDCGSRQKNAHLFTDAGHAYATRISHLTILIVLEMLNLESLTAHGAVRDAFITALLTDDNISSLHHEFTMHWTTLNEHGPVLMAWGAFLDMAQAFMAHDAFESIGQLMEHSVETLGAIQYLTEITTSVDEGDLNAVGYLSVIKGVASAILRMADLASIDDITGFIDLFCAIYSEQSLLIDQFWTQEVYAEESPLLKVLTRVTEDFPFDSISLLRVLTALSSSEEGAAQASAWLSALKTYQAILIPPALANVEDLRVESDELRRVRTTSSLTLDAITVPEGKIGIVLNEAPGALLVRFRLDYSGWSVLRRLLQRFLERLHVGFVFREGLPAIEAFAQFCASVWENCPACAELVPGHREMAQEWALTCERLLRHTEPPLTLLSSALRSVITLDMADTLESAIGARTAQRVMDATESRSGHYPFTLAVLDLAIAAVRNARRLFAQHRSSLEPLLMLVGRVWTAHASWRFLKTRDRALLELKCLQTLACLLEDTSFSSLPPLTEIDLALSESEDAPSLHPLSMALDAHRLHADVVRAFLHDQSFFDPLLKVIAIGPVALNSTLAQRRQEGETLESSVLFALHFLELVLQLKTDARTTPLEHAILTRNFSHNTDVVHILGDYVGYAPDQTLGALATRLLARLCELSVDRPLSLLGYLDAKRTLIRHVFLGRLLDRRLDVAARVAVLDLIESCVRFQPGLAALFLLPHTTSDNADEEESGLSALIKLLAQSTPHLMQNQPRLVAALMRVLVALWDRVLGDSARIVNLLRAKPRFWESLVAIFSGDPHVRDAKNEDNAYRVRAANGAAEVLVREVFCVPSESALDKSLESALQSVSKDGKLLLQRFLVPHFASLRASARAVVKAADKALVPLSVFGQLRSLTTPFLSLNIDLLRVKLDHEGFEQLIRTASEHSANLQLITAELDGISIWHDFLGVVMGRQPSLMPHRGKALIETILVLLELYVVDAEAPFLSHLSRVGKLLGLLVRQYLREDTECTNASTVSILRPLARALDRCLLVFPESPELMHDLLGSLLLLVRSLPQATDASAKLPEELTTTLLKSLNPILFRHSSLRAVVVSSLDSLATRSSYLPLESFYSNNHAAISLLVNLTGNCLTSLSGEVAETHADAYLPLALLRLLISLSANPRLAEAIVNESVFVALRVDNFVKSVLYPYTPPLASALHTCYTLSLALVTALLNVLGNRCGVVKDVTDFCFTHEAHLRASLTLAHHKAHANAGDGTQLTLRSLKETETTLLLLRELGKHMRHWSYSPRQLSDLHLGLALSLMDAVTPLVSDSRRLEAYLTPVTEAEIKSAGKRAESFSVSTSTDGSHNELQTLASGHLERIFASVLHYLILRNPVVPAEKRYNEQLSQFRTLFDPLLGYTTDSSLQLSVTVTAPTMHHFVDYLTFVSKKLRSVARENIASSRAAAVVEVLSSVDLVLHLYLTHVDAYLYMQDERISSAVLDSVHQVSLLLNTMNRDLPNLVKMQLGEGGKKTTSQTHLDSVSNPLALLMAAVNRLDVIKAQHSQAASHRYL